MLRKVEVENFISLKNVSVDLEPLTIFIGPNGSGKSAIFKALVTLSKLVGSHPLRPRGQGDEFSLYDGVTFDDLVWQGDTSLTVKFRLWFPEDTDNAKPGYTLEIAKRGAGWSVIRERMRVASGWIEVDETHAFRHETERLGEIVLLPPMRATLSNLVYPFRNDAKAQVAIRPILDFAKQFAQTWRYRPSASDIAAIAWRTDPEGEPIGYVRENGRGLALVLQTLQGADRATFSKIEQSICKLFPHIQQLGFKDDSRGVRLTFVTDRSKNAVPAPQEADGALLAAFLYWRLHTAGPGIRICLEEPENGLHPRLLGLRYEVLSKFARPEGGLPATQILVSTHSKELIEAAKGHPSSSGAAKLTKLLRLVDFEKDKGTSLRPVGVRGLEDELRRWWSGVSGPTEGK